MKLGMTWKIRAMGLVELTRRLAAFQGRQQDRGGQGGSSFGPLNLSFSLAV